MHRLKCRLIAVLTFAVGVSAAAYFRARTDTPARFRVTIPHAPEPVTELMVPNCGMLVVTIDRNSNLKLNTEGVGTVDDPVELTERLEEIFRWRMDGHAYDRGKEDRSDLPMEKRVMRTVIVRAPRSVAYARVVRTVDAIKAAGADPVGLQIDELPW